MTPPDPAPDFGSRTDFYTFAPERLAEALPDFEIVREVGKGSMGIVYEARRRADSQRVAVKVLPPSLTLTERALARFLREGEIMSRVCHPAIVRVFDLGRRDRLHYFVMEFVDGVNLEERLKVGPLPLRQAAEIGAQVAHALQFAHDRGVVHRDIKPGNLILRADGQIAITDFGLARETGTGSMTESGAIVGTPMFMAPEQVLGDRSAIGTRADVYGLGSTLYTLVTGQPPFTGPTAQSVLKQVIDDAPVPPRRLRAELPDAFQNIILKAMAKSPAHRYGSAQELAEDLERSLRGERVLARRPSPVQRALRAAADRPLLTTLVALILVLLAGGLALQHDRQLRRLQAELAVAERTLAQAASLRDDQLRKLSPEERKSLLHSAIAQASKVIAMDSGFARAWFVRAKAHHQLQDFRQTLDDLDMAAQILDEPTAEILHYRIDAASHLHDRGSRELLRKDLYSLLDLDPGRYNRCIVARHLLDMAVDMPERARGEALDSAARIIAPIDEPDGNTLVVEARLLELRGETALALGRMRDACRLFQGDLLVHSAAAEMFQRMGLHAEGNAEAEIVHMLDPEFTSPSGRGGERRAVDVGEVEGFLQNLEALIRAVNRGGDADADQAQGR